MFSKIEKLIFEATSYETDAWLELCESSLLLLAAKIL